MALKQIVLRKRLEGLTAQMNGAEETRAELEARRAAMQLREEELEKAVGEVTEETGEEEKAALDEETAKWEQDEEALAKAEEENAETTRKLQEQIDELQAELNELEQRSKMAAEHKAAANEERKVEKTMNTRKFFGMNTQERDAFFALTEVKDFIANTRSMIKEKRAVNGADLTIPTVILDLIRERVGEYSKLLKHVNVQRINGKGRVNVMGVVPEAIWTEMCAKLNDIDLSFGAVELDGYKVGAFVAVCNAVLEDNEVELATKVIEALGKAMGRALDKAILFGTGVKMPTGILTALEAGEHKSTNIVSISGKTGTALFKAIITAAGEAANDYSAGSMFWAMNAKTKSALVAEAVTFNAAGAVVSGQNGEMPVIGGKIELVSDIPDNVIIGGYGELYAMVERAEMKFATSEEVRFIDDQTVFKGTARYDGKPAVEKAFVAISLTADKPTAVGVTFAPGAAN